jgi:Flagellar hook-length control protein FliK
MTATLAPAAPDLKTALRLPQDRRAPPDTLNAASEFLLALEESVAEDVGDADVQLENNEAEAGESPADADTDQQPRIADLRLPMPQFLLAAHHVATPVNAGQESLLLAGRPVITSGGKSNSTEQPAAKPADVTILEKSSLDDLWQPEEAIQELAAVPITNAMRADKPEPQPEAVTITALPIRPLDSEVRPPQRPREDVTDRSDAKPADVLAIATNESRETGPSPPSTGQLPHPTAPLPAAQVVAKLEPAINQAQTILRILEAAGSPGPAVRTLQFGLRPSDLGEVRVTLSLAGDRLDLRIETQSEEAARRLDLDRSLLDAMLAQSGVTAERGQIDIRTGRFEPLPPATSFIESGRREGGEPAGAFSHGERQPGGPPHGNKDRSHHASTHDQHSVERGSGGVYL